MCPIWRLEAGAGYIRVSKSSPTRTLLLSPSQAGSLNVYTGTRRLWLLLPSRQYPALSSLCLWLPFPSPHQKGQRAHLANISSLFMLVHVVLSPLATWISDMGGTGAEHPGLEWKQQQCAQVYCNNPRHLPSTQAANGNHSLYHIMQPRFLMLLLYLLWHISLNQNGYRRLSAQGMLPPDHPKEKRPEQYYLLAQQKCKPTDICICPGTPACSHFRDCIICLFYFKHEIYLLNKKQARNIALLNWLSMFVLHFTPRKH